MTKKISESLFSSILYLFSSSMLILSLLMSIKLNAISDQVNRAEDEIGRLKKENALLCARMEKLTNIESIIEYAENAGMVKSTAETVEFLSLSGNG